MKVIVATPDHVTMSLMALLVNLLLLLMVVDAEDRCTEHTSIWIKYGCRCLVNHNELDVSCTNTSLSRIPDDFPPDITLLTINFNPIQYLVYIANYSELYTLDLTNNNLRWLGDAAFSNLTHLFTLHLDNNNISGLTAQTFLGLKRTKFIYLSNNPLFVVETGVFSYQNLPELQEVYLSHCQLYEIKPNAFQGQQNLSKLHLSHNKFKYPLGFGRHTELPNLNTLVLSHCRITSLPHVLSFMPKLSNLDLSFNHIEQINVFSTIHGLHTPMLSLNISWNKLTMIRASAFAGIKLNTIDLSHNALTYLYWEEWQMDEQGLTAMQVDHNPWNCSCMNAWMVEDDDWHSVMWNNNDKNQTRCAYPAKYANQSVFTVPSEAFYCPHRAHHSNVKAIVVPIIMLLLVIVFLLVFFLRRRYKRIKSGHYRRFDAMGMHM